MYVYILALSPELEVDDDVVVVACSDVDFRLRDE